jgi:Na+/H+ antiporter NhaD/arsenite permease-like protein
MIEFFTDAIPLTLLAAGAAGGASVGAVAGTTPGAEAAAVAHAVAPWITYLFAGVLGAMILCLALEEKIHAKKSVIVGVFAVGSLLLGTILHIIPFGQVVLPGGHEIKMAVYIPAVDWSVIAIILGSSIFVDVTSKSGLFTWIAIKLTKASKGDPLILLWFYGLMTVVFSAVLNNVTAMIIVGSLSAVSLSKLKRSDKLLGFLLIEGLLTNVGGLLTLISSVPNIIVGNAAGIPFIVFFIKAAPYVAVTTCITIMMGARLFKINRLKTDEEKAEAKLLVSSFDENDGIESKGFFWFGAGMLVLFILCIAGASVKGWALNDLGMGYVALAFGTVMLIKVKASADNVYKAVDWDLLAFFGGLFITINVMEHAHVLNLIGDGLRPIISMGELTGSGLMLISAAAASSVTDNIPLAAMLAKILAATPAEVNIAGNPDSPFWWSVIFGANLGGNLTPIGSASTLVAVTIMHKHDLKLSFAGFVVKAIPYALLHLALATAYVLLFLS